MATAPTFATGTELIDAILAAVSCKEETHIGSIQVQQIHIEAAKRIGWLRTYFNTGSAPKPTGDANTTAEPEDKQFLGALGEVIIFSLTSTDVRARPVSIVSCRPVQEADLAIYWQTQKYEVEYQERFDIKTSYDDYPGFYVKYESHQIKQRPHILCVVLNRQRTKADVFIVHQHVFELDWAKAHFRSNGSKSWASLKKSDYHIPVGPTPTHPHPSPRTT